METATSQVLTRLRAEHELARLNGEPEHRSVERPAESTLISRRMGAILETALDALVTMDHEGRIVEFNPAAERIFGFDRSEVIGRSPADSIIPPAWRDAPTQGLAHYLATGAAAVLGNRIEL